MTCREIRSLNGWW